jgi:hypothetical protein
MVKATVTDVIPAVLPGMYPARFDGVEDASNETGSYWKWTFTLDVPGVSIGDVEQYGDEGALIPVTATSSPRITPRTKAAQYLEGLGVKVEVGTEVDFDALAGRTCQVIIALSDTGYSRIAQVLPPAPVKPVKADK